MRYEKSHRRPWRWIGAGTGAVALLVGVATWNVLRPVAAVAVSQAPVVAATQPGTPLAWPAGAEAAVEVQGVTPILTNGPQKALPTASIAKVITALTVLQKYPLASASELGPVITYTQADLDRYNAYVAKDGSVVGVAPGEQMRERQALEALMLPSANNIADSLAVWAFGSLDAYKTAATQYLKGLGLTNTTIGADASGLDPGTTSTPSDMVRLGEQALANVSLTAIVAEKSAGLPTGSSTNDYTVYNVNRLVGQDGIIGIKTGNSDEVGGNLLFAAKAEAAKGKPVTIIGVVMGLNSLDAALNTTPPLLDSVKANVYVATPVHAGQTIATYHTVWGASATATAQKDLSLVAWKGSAITPKVELQRAGVAYTAGTSVGTVSVTSGTSAGSTGINMTAGLPGPTFWWRLTRH